MLLYAGVKHFAPLSKVSLGGGMEQAKLFGRRVRAIRKAARITQERIAEQAQINPKYLGELERGEKKPSFDALLAIAKALHVSPAIFFHFDKEENDERVLRRKIEVLLHDRSPQQLQQAYRILRTLLEP
jgi:transcriptional regulator with XRE-family HTH domain